MLLDEDIYEELEFLINYLSFCDGIFDLEYKTISFKTLLKHVIL